MLLNRRHFLFLSATFAAGCAAPGGSDAATGFSGGMVNAGPASQYLSDGVYTQYRNHGFFIVRHGAKLFAISSICTHRKCKLNARTDKTFYCPCHGSTFDPDGHVTKAPARRNLPVYEISTNEKGELLVNLS
jgi:Rieske Fe-S protein